MTLSTRSLRRVALLGLLLILAGPASCRRRGSVATTGSDHQPGGDAPDVVLITLDTVRADAFGFAGNRQAETPILDRLAAEGLVFDSARASNVVTLPSHANMLTGLYPYQHGIRDNTGFRLGAGVPTLASFLSERGYATGAFVGAFPLDSRYGLDRGFDVYDDRYPPGDSPEDFEVRERPATEVIAAARAWYAKEKGRRRFLWVHLYDAHAPYRPPASFAARHPGNPYLAEVAAVDAALAPLLSDLRSEASRAPLVIVTADHGEALGDHGELTHGLFAYEATLKVPLLVWSPGRVPPGRTDRPVSHVDIFPTVAGTVGSAPPAGTAGRSLLTAGAAGATYFEALSASLNRGWAPLTGMVEGNYKFIDLPLPELYDLRSDPNESTNLSSKLPDVVRRLKGLMPRASSAARTAPGSEEARRLLSLGYLSGSGGGKTSWTEEDDPKRLVEIDSKIHGVIASYQEGDLPGATRLARQILRERPGMPVAYEFLSFLLQQAGREAEAADVIAASIRSGLASEPLRVRLALILSESGRSTEALRALEPLRGSADPETLNAIGIVLSDAGRLAEAREVFERILRTDAGDAVTHQNLGIALLKGGDAAGALQRLDRALAIAGALPRAWNAKGVAQARLGDEAGAITSWQRAAEIDPRQFDALLNIGVVASGRGETAVAREALRKFVRSAPPALYGRDLARARQLLRSLGGA